MFATLRYSPEEGTISVQRTHGPMEGTGHHRSSCDSCRIKKLRCSSEKDGCERCRARRIRCIYTTAPEKKKQNRRSRRASETSSSSFENFYNEGLPMGRVHSDIFREVNVQSGHQTYAGSEDGGSIPRSNSTYSVDKLVADLGPQGSIASNGVPNTGQYRHREGSKDSISIGNANYFDVMNFLPFGADGSISSYPVSDFSSSPDVMSNQSFLASPSVAQWDAVGGIEMPSTAQPGPGIDMSTHGFPQTQFHPVQCQCLNHGIQILGDLELHIQQNTLASIDLTLAMQKRALLHSARMIDCKLCNTQSACKTTLILLCEKLIILFQSVAAVCLEQRKALRRQQLGENLGPNNTNFDTGQKMRLGEYELDSTHELGFVGSMLALLQGQRLLGMVARLKSFAVATGSDLQLSRLADSELRVANTMRDLKRASSDATGKT